MYPAVDDDDDDDYDGGDGDGVGWQRFRMAAPHTALLPLFEPN